MYVLFSSICISLLIFSTDTNSLSVNHNSGEPVITPSQSNLKEGDEITLNCSTSLKGFSRFEWSCATNKDLFDWDTKNKVLSKQWSSFSYTDKQFYALNEWKLLREDNGTVCRCTIQNPATGEGKQLETSYTLNVNYRPRIDLFTTNYEKINLGNSVTLACEVDANPKISSFRWTKNGIITTTTTSTYVIQKVGLEEAGTYTCIADNGFGKTEAQIVFKIVTIEGNNNGILEFEQGSNVRVKCLVSSNHDPTTVTWYKIREPNYIEEFVQSGEILHIPKITLDSAGSYLCKASLSTIETSTGKQVKEIGNDLVQLYVNHKPGQPIITASQSNLKEGDKVTLNCSSSPAGWPKATYTWCKEPYSMHMRGDILDIQQIKQFGNTESCYEKPDRDYATYELKLSRKDNGAIYKCEVQTKALGEGNKLVAKYKMKVYYNPKVKVVIKDYVNNRLGKSVTLECKVDSNPKVDNVTWIRNGKIVATTFTYDIKKVESQDLGTYVCTADNGFGKAEGVYILDTDIQYAPKVRIEGNYNELVIDEGKSASIKCIVEANPAVTSVEWFKVGQPNFTQSGKVLNLSRVTDRWAGIYFCEAKNKKGIGYEAVELFVRDKFGTLQKNYNRQFQTELRVMHSVGSALYFEPHYNSKTGEFEFIEKSS